VGGVDNGAEPSEEPVSAEPSRELQLLTRTVDLSAFERVARLLTADDFVAWPEAWTFLEEYYAAHKRTPSRATLDEALGSFPFCDNELDLEWLSDCVSSERVKRAMRAMLVELADAVDIDPRDAVRMNMDMLAKIMPNVRTSDEAIDLRATILDDFTPTQHGITTGFDLLDEATNGTKPGEIEMWFGRPGEGKTFFMLWGAYKASYAQHRVVSFISPEMNAAEIRMRFYAMQYHYSQSNVQAGRLDDEWSQFQEDMREWSNTPHPPFNFYSGDGHGRSFTTADIASIIHRDKPELLCIDGLLFIQPMRQVKTPRERVLAAVEELKQIVVTTGVPMRIAHQANRESQVSTSLRRKELTVGDLIPDLHHLAESDATGQFANRAIAIRGLNGRVYFAIRKNRGGRPNLVFSVNVDFDRAHIMNETYASLDSQPGADSSSNDDDGQPELDANIF
jgi:hypothetical protein